MRPGSETFPPGTVTAPTGEAASAGRAFEPSSGFPAFAAAGVREVRATANVAAPAPAGRAFDLFVLDSGGSVPLARPFGLLAADDAVTARVSSPLGVVVFGAVSSLRGEAVAAGVEPPGA